MPQEKVVEDATTKEELRQENADLEKQLDDLTKEVKGFSLKPSEDGSPPGDGDSEPKSGEYKESGDEKSGAVAFMHIDFRHVDNPLKIPGGARLGAKQSLFSRWMNTWFLRQGGCDPRCGFNDYETRNGFLYETDGNNVRRLVSLTNARADLNISDAYYELWKVRPTSPERFFEAFRDAFRARCRELIAKGDEEIAKSILIKFYFMTGGRDSEIDAHRQHFYYGMFEETPQ